MRTLAPFVLYAPCVPFLALALAAFVAAWLAALLLAAAFGRRPC